MIRSSIMSLLDQILGFLQSDSTLLMRSEERDEFLGRARELQEKARESGETLYVGIVGGTGVGKSTLINALAEKQISQSSDRRPFTDKAVIYRHEDVHRGLDDINGLIRNPDALHDSVTVKDLILMDLPDFDSLMEENRRTVLQILPFLDAIVWVVSPEKYADASLYDFLGKTPIHKENFTFVLNKADELVDGESAEHPIRLKEILGDLAFRLKHEAGVEQPRIFSLSAENEFLKQYGSTILKTEFIRFRQFLMVKRDAKEIASIKTSNLLEEVGRLVSELNSTVRPMKKQAALEKIKSFEVHCQDLEKEWTLSFQDQERRLTEILLRSFMAADRSISLVKWGMKFVNLGRSFSIGRRDGNLNEIFREAAEAIGRDRRLDLEKAAAAVDSELLLTFDGTEILSGREKPDQIVNAAVSRASIAFAGRVNAENNALTGLRSKWTRFFQKSIVLLPVLVLALKLAGTDNVIGWFDQPSLGGALKISAHILTSIFGPEGLTGMTALLIFELLAAWFLASRRLNYLEKISGRLAKSAIDILDEELDSISARVKNDRKALLQSIENEIGKLNSINGSLQSFLS